MGKISEIQDMASECLNCKNPKCREGCPISTNIPEFIQHIKNSRLAEAYGVLQSNNIMSEICSQVCPTETQCMGKCVKGIKGQPVSINKLEGFVNDWAKENSVGYEITRGKNNNQKVAIIGAGPSGISCGVELIKKGYNVTIFEKEKNIGGVLEYEIPDFRLPKENLKNINQKIEDIGITVKYNVELGVNLSIQELIENGYKAVFLGLGASIPQKYKLVSREKVLTYTANEILRKYHNNEKIQHLGNSIIIGGGNVAIDVARTINKIPGNSSTIIYRRNRELMPAIKTELEEAIKEGVKIIYNAKVIEAYYNKEDKIEKVKCIKTKLENNEVIDIKESEFEVCANSIVFAIGIKVDEKLFQKLGIKTKDGLVEIDENHMTNIPGVFAGGDLIEKRPTVCKAIATGKKAAIRNRKVHKK